MTTGQSQWSTAFNRFGLGARSGEGVRTGDPRQALVDETRGAACRSARRSRAALKSANPAGNFRLRVAKEARARRGGRRPQGFPRHARRRKSPRWSFPRPRKPLPTRRRPRRAWSRARRWLPAPRRAPPRGPRPNSWPFAPTPQRVCSGPAQRRSVSSKGWSRSGPITFACPWRKATSAASVAGAFEREAIRPACARPVCRHAARRREAPGDAQLPRQSAVDRANSKIGHNRNAASTKIWLAKFSNCTRWASAPAIPRATSTQLAYILTGWTFAGREGKLGEPGTFVFNANAHEPTAATLLGRRLHARKASRKAKPRSPISRARARRRDHIATKFARHFVADFPIRPGGRARKKSSATPTAILRPLALALVDEPVAWSAPRDENAQPVGAHGRGYRAFRAVPRIPARR